MRFGYVLLVVAATVFAFSCDVTSAATESSHTLRSADDVPSSRLLRTTEAENPAQRRLVKKLPLPYIQELVNDDKKLVAALTSWQEGKVTVKGLAKSLDLSTNRFKWFRNIRNRGKVDQATVLEKFRAHMGQ
ncbi:hypothetical protein ON010_g9034 [Phytophthora cinnamomi]|nr:hypothetical protein ON010_g9034 [Phytophthora cinnamomi]